jgi:outer membrane protein assembly factor BamB/predicted negative regulator of RcsB-dependent stress response
MNAFRSRSCAGLSVCLALTISSLAHVGAQGLLEIGGDQILPAGAIVLGDVDPFGASRSKANHLESAEMKTDSSSQEILAQADQFVKQERYDLASILWQRVIDESGDQVFTRDEWKERTLRNEYHRYRSVSGDIESTLAKLPPEGLGAYRLKADGEARALMTAADANNRESALAEIVRRFFLSKLGDEAAFELACLKLDRGEFLPAARLLSKILNDYPDPTVRLGEIKLRLAVVNARVGDLKLAREMLGAMKSEPIPPVPMAVINLVEADFEVVAGDRIAAAERSGSWTMPQGGATRTGLMPAMVADPGAGLIRSWVQRYELTLPEGEAWEAIGEMQASAEEKAKEKADPTELAQMLNADPFQRQLATPEREPPTDDEIVARWKEHAWLPVGQVLLDRGRVYFKTDDRVVCCNAATGELNWWGFPCEYPEDPIAGMTANLVRSGRSLGQSAVPTGERELISFSDTLNQSMSIVGDKLLVVQGRALDFYEDGDLDEAGLEDQPQFGRLRFRAGQQLTEGRARKNRLFAYDMANEGKLLWILKASDLLAESKRTMAFAGSPVPYGSLVVVPVYEATSLWLFGLDPDDGKVLWKTFLADEPAGQTAMNSPIRVAIDGGEAYVATGSGIIASVDAISGALNWAVSYPRTAPMAAAAERRNPMSYYQPAQAKLDGWVDDTIIPSGNAIVFAASDFNCLAALDRRTGSLLWESARRPIEGEPESEYVLGVSGGMVCVAGSKIVRAYKLNGGRLLWEYLLDDVSSGRGMLTKSGIYIPLDNSIVRLAVADGSLLEKIEVETGEPRQPLGNLYTDGERIYSAGYRQVKALRIRESGESLPQAAAAGDAEGDWDLDTEPGVDSHLSLALEVEKIVAEIYDRLGDITDVAGAIEAGKDFQAAGERLGEIAQRMEAQGAPDAGTRAKIERRFSVSNAENSEKLSESIGQIILIEDGQVELTTDIANFLLRAGDLPILKAYGITIDQLSNDAPKGE